MGVTQEGRCLAFDAVIPGPVRLLDRVRDQCANRGSPNGHGEAHWRAVAAMGLDLLDAGCPAQPAALFMFSVLHDACRIHDGQDPGHGDRAADLAATLRDDGLIRGNDAWFEALAATLREHELGRIADDPTVGACWDADRLTLPRYGTRINADMLSTFEARELITEAERVGPLILDWPDIIAGYAGEDYGESPPPGAVFYHGGPAGLEAGDFVLPPKATQVQTTAPRRNKVYVTTAPELAFLHAGRSTVRGVRSMIYQVEPTGKLRHDLCREVPTHPFSATTVAWMCESARIVAVHRAGPTAAEVAGIEEFFDQVAHDWADSGGYSMPSPYRYKALFESWQAVLQTDHADLLPAGLAEFLSKSCDDAKTPSLPEHVLRQMADDGVWIWEMPGPPAPRPCGSCIWKPGEDACRQERLWPDVADGETQACHVGDPRQPGCTSPTSRECCGATILVARELKRLDGQFNGDVDRYVAASPRGLTRRGIRLWRDHEHRSARYGLDLDQGIVQINHDAPAPKRYAARALYEFARSVRDTR